VASDDERVWMVWCASVVTGRIDMTILDRIVHNAHRIKLKGPSRRKPEKQN
jgi:DNA replication protein DnaC